LTFIFTQLDKEESSMSVFDIFRPKPKPCSSCGKTTRSLHNVWSGLRNGELSGKLCTACLISKLQLQIKGKNILFIEPLTMDAYCFTPLDDNMTGKLTRERTKLALTSLDKKCAQCSSSPQHLWMQREELDEEAMEQQAENAYYSIPSLPSSWKTTESLCEKHLLETLKQYIEKSGSCFGTFRFPNASKLGFYD
jgi:hypothetical protein